MSGSRAVNSKCAQKGHSIQWVEIPLGKVLAALPIANLVHSAVTVRVKRRKSAMPYNDAASTGESLRPPYQASVEPIMYKWYA